jgi:hypothetical protein
MTNALTLGDRIKLHSSCCHISSVRRNTRVGLDDHSDNPYNLALLVYSVQIPDQALLLGDFRGVSPEVYI